MTDITTRLSSMSEAMWMDRSQDDIDALLLEAKGEIERLREALTKAADQLALVHDDAFKQAAGYGLVTSDGRDFSCFQLNLCETASRKARAALIPQQKGNADAKQ